MKHLKYALITTVAFSSMTALAQENQKPESSRNVHIAKCVGYSAATAVHIAATIILGRFVYEDYNKGKLDPGLNIMTLIGVLVGVYSFGSLTWLAKYHGYNAIDEYKKAFPTPNTEKEEDSHEAS